MSPSLSILVVTEGKANRLPYLYEILKRQALFTCDPEMVVVCARNEEYIKKNTNRISLEDLADIVNKEDGWFHHINNEGMIVEYALNSAASYCKGDYILRIDDDEIPSLSMISWINDNLGKVPINSFPRVNLYGTHFMMLGSPPLWPDYQTRLTHRDSFVRPEIVHSGHPGGQGAICPEPIIHYKYLVESLIDRHNTALIYESNKEGAGFGDTYRPFSLPETVPDMNGAIYYELSLIKPEEFFPIGYWPAIRKNAMILLS